MNFCGETEEWSLTEVLLSLEEFPFSMSFLNFSFTPSIQKIASELLLTSLIIVSSVINWKSVNASLEDKLEDKKQNKQNACLSLPWLTCSVAAVL